MSPIAEDSLAPASRRWGLVAAALAALFIAAIVLLAAHASPAGAAADHPANVLDNGL